MITDGLSGSFPPVSAFLSPYAGDGTADKSAALPPADRPAARGGPGMALRLALIGAAYFAAHLVGLISHVPGVMFTVVWPASGVGAAILLLSPKRQWAAIAGVLYATGLCADHLVHRDAPAGYLFMVANVFESVVAAWFIERIGSGKVTFDKVREVLALALASTGINALSASIGAGTATLIYGTSFTHIFQVWWVENSVAMVLLTSLIVAFARLGLQLLPAGRLRPARAGDRGPALPMACHRDGTPALRRPGGEDPGARAGFHPGDAAAAAGGQHSGEHCLSDSAQGRCAPPSDLYQRGSGLGPRTRSGNGGGVPVHCLGGRV